KYLPLWDWRNGAPAGGYNPLFAELVRVLGVPVRTGPQPDAAPQSRPPEPRIAEQAVPRPVPEQRREDALPARPPSSQARFIDFTDVSWIDYPIAALFLVPFALLLADVVARQVFQQPLTTAYELTLMTSGVAALLGAAVAVRNNRSIRSPASLLLL